MTRSAWVSFVGICAAFSLGYLVAQFLMCGMPRGTAEPGQALRIITVSLTESQHDRKTEMAVDGKAVSSDDLKRLLKDLVQSTGSSHQDYINASKYIVVFDVGDGITWSQIAEYVNLCAGNGIWHVFLNNGSTTLPLKSHPYVLYPFYGFNRNRPKEILLTLSWSKADTNHKNRARNEALRIGVRQINVAETNDSQRLTPEQFEREKEVTRWTQDPSLLGELVSEVAAPRVNQQVKAYIQVEDTVPVYEVLRILKMCYRFGTGYEVLAPHSH